MGIPKATLGTGTNPLGFNELAPLLKFLQNLQLLDYQIVSGTTSASATAQEFRHGLKRRYVGAFIVGANGDMATCPLPTSVSDPSRFFAVKPASATAINFSVLVF